MPNKDWLRSKGRVGLAALLTGACFAYVWSCTNRKGDTSATQTLEATPMDTEPSLRAAAVSLQSIGQAQVRVSTLNELEKSLIALIQNPLGDSAPATGKRTAQLAASSATGRPTAQVRIDSEKDSGLGSYVLMPGAFDRGLHLQIPHGESDVHTRKIGEALCAEFLFSSCGFNSDHRRSFDFAHEENSPFQTLIRVVTDQDPTALFVQIHGFSAEKRPALRDRSATMILSGGRKELAPVISEALKSLGEARDPGIRIFGEDTNDLGATANVQNVLVQQLAKGRFLHIELSYASRVSLAADPKERQRLYQIIEAVARSYQSSSGSNESSKNASR